MRWSQHQYRTSVQRNHKGCGTGERGTERGKENLEGTLKNGRGDQAALLFW